jgi:DNA-binding transcriptional MerR regulator
MKLNTKKFAGLCGVSTSTIRCWSRKNKLNFICTKGGQRRYDESEVIIFLNKSKRNSINIIEDLKKYETSSPEYMKAW